MENEMEWLSMGGYAWFVWPAYGAAILILLWAALSPYYRHKKLIRGYQSTNRRANLGEPSARAK